MTPKRFRDIVLAQYETHGRHDLPWRKTRDPYHILVSEVMLQQTQVDRVIPFYTAFLTEFPTIEALAKASLSRVLVRWQGLGYNRRAKMLSDAAKAVMREHGGRLPRTVAELETLPGIGPYTARAIAAFAHNEDVVFVETNLRTAVIHHFFPEGENVQDKDILLILEKAFPKGDARRWYSALMDYGARLKRSGIRLNQRSSAYTKQAAFTGSGREVRGAILRALAEKPRTDAHLSFLLGPERKEQVRLQLEKLVSEGLIEKTRSTYRLPH